MSEIRPEISDDRSTPTVEPSHVDHSTHIGNDPSNLVYSTDPAPPRLYDIEKGNQHKVNIMVESCQIPTQCSEIGNECRKALPAAKLAFFQETNDRCEDEDAKNDHHFDSKFALRENQIGKPVSVENVDICEVSNSQECLNEVKIDSTHSANNQGWKSDCAECVDQIASNIEHPHEGSLNTTKDDILTAIQASTLTTAETDTLNTARDTTLTAQEEDECEQFTRNFKSALQQAEARGQQTPTINTQTFQPLRRATKRISNRIQFLQDHLQEEVTSGFANRKSIERLKKQLAEAEELSANFQSIRKHQRSVSRSGRSTTRTRHSTTPGKRERPYRHWLGLAKVVTPGPDNRFIISSREDRPSKTTITSLDFQKSCKKDNTKEVSTKEIAVNTIIEETEPDCSHRSQCDDTDTEAMSEPKRNGDENLDVQQDNETIPVSESPLVNNKTTPISSSPTKNHKSIELTKKSPCSSNPEYSPGGDKTDSSGALADIANAIQRLDLKQANASVGNDLFKSVSLNNFVLNKDVFDEQSEGIISYKPNEKLNSDAAVLVEFGGYKEVKNKMVYGEHPTMFKSSTLKNEYLPAHTNNATTKMRFEDPFNTPGMIYEQFSFSQSTHSSRTHNQEGPPPSNQFASSFCDRASDPHNPCLHFTPPLQDAKEVSPPITKQRFTSPYYIPKRSAASKAYHPRPLGYCNTLPKAGYDNQRLRRHKERSSSRMAARSGSRSVARRPRGAGQLGSGEELTLPLNTDVFYGDFDKEIEAMRKQVACEQPLLNYSAHPEKVVSPYDISDRDIHETLQAATKARLMNRINIVRRTQKGTKYIPVRAIQDYKGKLPGQLGFKAGQSIKLRCPDVEPPDGLCYGYYRKGRLRTKKKGLFPISCVELQSEMQTAL